jgi:hypothetical protein
MTLNHDAERVVKKSIIVSRDVVGAFRVWTEQITTWWPADHSLSGDPTTQVFIESKVGGRFFERTSAGVEYEWGRVVVWEPPLHLAYTWYLGSSPELPTRVDVRFVALDKNRTQVKIEHRGPELIGDVWWANQVRYLMAWDKVLPHYGQACRPD